MEHPTSHSYLSICYIPSEGYSLLRAQTICWIVLNRGMPLLPILHYPIQRTTNTLLSFVEMLFSCMHFCTLTWLSPLTQKGSMGKTSI